MLGMWCGSFVLGKDCRNVETEPWMRGTHAELNPVVRAVVHALELAEEDVVRWCAPLGDAAMFARPNGVAPVAFHLRHIVRSLDRLLTYAETEFHEDGSEVLSEAQRAALRSEMDVTTAAEVLAEFRAGLAAAMQRVMRVTPAQFGEVRGIGRKRLPTTVAGLLIHCAEHTSRHVGQAVTTAQVVGKSS